MKYLVFFVLFVGNYAFASKVSQMIESVNDQEVYALLVDFDDGAQQEKEALSDLKTLESFCERLMKLDPVQLEKSFTWIIPFLRDRLKKELADFACAPHTWALIMRFQHCVYDPWPTQIMESFILNSEDIKEIYPEVFQQFVQNPPKELLGAMIKLKWNENFLSLLIPSYPNFNQSTLFFPEIPGYAKSPRGPKIPTVAIADATRYVNQDGYLKEKFVCNPKQNCHLSNPLLLDDGTPIGYTIYFHTKQPIPDTFLIEVYGGSNTKGEVPPFKPRTSDFTKFLISEGIGVIELNLPDHLKSNNRQRQQEAEVHALVQRAIHHFVQTFKTNPSILHPTLDSIATRQLRLFLYGASFGGRTAFKYAASPYGEDFAGYISHDGSLDYRQLEMSQRFYEKSSKSSVQDIGVTLPHIALNQEDISSIKKRGFPLLVLHNLDDNNVNPAVALSFYKKARLFGLKAMELYITKSANSIPSGNERMCDKGHFLPVGEREFAKYMRTLIHFIQHGPVAQEISHARFYKYNMHSKRYNISASCEQKLISEAFLLYLQTPARDDAPVNPSDILDPDNQEKAWHVFYRPLYYTLVHLNRIRSNITKMSDLWLNLFVKQVYNEMIEDALSGVLKPFIAFVEECNAITIPRNQLDMDKLKSDLQEPFRKNLVIDQWKSNLNVYLSNWGYMLKAHPYLLNTIFSEADRQPWYLDEIKAKNRFILSLRKYRETQSEKKGYKNTTLSLRSDFIYRKRLKTYLRRNLRNYIMH